jgi:hypothetical protein
MYHVGSVRLLILLSHISVITLRLIHSLVRRQLCPTRQRKPIWSDISIKSRLNALGKPHPPTASRTPTSEVLSDDLGA